MRKLTYLAIFAVALAAGAARADDGGGDDCDGIHCRPRTRDVCFNVVCHYDLDRDLGDRGDGHDEGRHCKVAAEFVAPVTIGGGEVTSDSDERSAPRFEVTCDGKPVYNDSAHRYTDLLGTRIQGETGPHPAITLERGALHTGPDHDSGYHQSPSTLILEDEGVKVGHGTCDIWTGAP
jgi:hypothetical protein